MTDEASGDYIKNIYQVDIPLISMSHASGVNNPFYVSMTCATPGRKIFFRVHGFAGQGWTIRNVGGPTSFGGGTINTGWYEWDETPVSLPIGSTSPKVYAIAARDSATPSMRVWAYATLPGMADSVVNIFTYDPQGRAGWLWGS